MPKLKHSEVLLSSRNTLNLKPRCQNISCPIGNLAQSCLLRNDKKIIKNYTDAHSPSAISHVACSLASLT